MPTNGDRAGKKRSRRPGSPLLWFLLVSLLFHHAVVVSVVEVPDLTSYDRFDVDLVEGTDEQDEDLVARAEPLDEPDLVVPETMDDVIAPSKKPRPDEDDEPEEPEETLVEPDSEKDDLPEPRDAVPMELVELEGLHFVDIRENETDEPPPDAEYFAPINSQVDEETKAENTNLDEDQMQSQPESGGEPADTPGNAPDFLAGHLVEEDVQPTEDSPVKAEPEDPDLADTTPAPAPASEDDPQGLVAEKSIESKASPATPLLTPDTAPPISLEVSEDGELFDPTTGAAIPTFAEAKKSKKQKGGDVAGDEPMLADLDMSYSDAQGVLGAEMEKMQEEYKEAKKSKQKGGFTGDVGKVMSQLENFIPDVKPGNQTALNAAYHPYAEYITAFHRNLHPQWGDGFLVSLVTKPNGDPLNDMDLMVKLEFVVLPDGSIEKVTVVKASGLLIYDVAAIDAIYAGEPYPPPPDVIKSYDGKVYMRWGFYRNHSQCGVWNAEPYILTGPGTKKKKVKIPKEKQAGKDGA